MGTICVWSRYAAGENAVRMIKLQFDCTETWLPLSGVGGGISTVP